MKSVVEKAKVMAVVLWESVVFPFTQLKVDKFRTFLSLLGVTVGIFSIVAVFTAVDALKENVKRGLDSFGSDVVTISQWPMGGEDDEGNVNAAAEYKWWEYMRRPAPSYQDYRYLKENSTKSEAVALSIQYTKTVKYGRNSISNCNINSVTSDWDLLTKVELSQGRYFSEYEINSTSNVAIVGYEIWEELFDGADPVGKEIKVGNRLLTVIGLFEKVGESMVSLGNNTDQSIMVPIQVGRQMVNIRNSNVSIYAKPRAEVDSQEFCDELLLLMRSHRRLAPGEKNNFSIGKMTFILELVGTIFSSLNTVGWIIAGFSLLIGGFGIANIMFVSVKERTNIIGIQKALGAKRYLIMIQFLTESLMLSFAGGIMGILLVCAAIWLVPSGSAFTLSISISNILSGMAISLIIGILSGSIPAWHAANLKPVEAINSK